MEPLKSVMRKTKTYQSSPFAKRGKVRNPFISSRVGVNPLSSRTSRMAQASGVSPGSNFPPSPFHFPMWMSPSFLFRWSMSVFPFLRR